MKSSVKMVYVHCHPDSRPYVSFKRGRGADFGLGYWPGKASLLRLTRLIYKLGWELCPVVAGDFVGWMAFPPSQGGKLNASAAE